MVAKNGYAADVWRCCGICREMWRWIAPELSEEDAARVRRDHPFWQAIIDLPHGTRRRTRLMLAAARDKLVHVETLIAWHADVNAAGQYGYTALMHASEQASMSGRLEVVRALLAAGAGVDAANALGQTALLLACSCYCSNVEIARSLLAGGADVDVADITGRTALMCASANGLVEVVRVLLAAGANKHCTTTSGDTAYSLARPGSWRCPSFFSAAIRALLDLVP